MGVPVSLKSCSLVSCSRPQIAPSGARASRRTSSGCSTPASRAMPWAPHHLRQAAVTRDARWLQPIPPRARGNGCPSTTWETTTRRERCTRKRSTGLGGLEGAVAEGGAGAQKCADRAGCCRPPAIPGPGAGGPCAGPPTTAATPRAGTRPPAAPSFGADASRARSLAARRPALGAPAAQPGGGAAPASEARPRGAAGTPRRSPRRECRARAVQPWAQRVHGCGARSAVLYG